MSCIDHVIEQRRRDLGGFEVGRVLPAGPRRMVGPFIFFDHMGPTDLPRGIPRSVDVRPHPHIGLSTVTYLFDGEIMHRDSLGSEQPIRPGEVNWMTAGRGITHSERFERARSRGDHLHGIQSWIALPAEHEETAPAFSHIAASQLPAIDDAGVSMRLIAGSAFGSSSPVRTFSPSFYLHMRLNPGARASLPGEYTERAAYIVAGSAEVDGGIFSAGRMLVFTPGVPAVLTAPGPAVIMLLGGEPIGQRHIEWNFVSSSRDRIEQAKADWRAGRMQLPQLDDRDYIPLPAETGPSHPAPL